MKRKTHLELLEERLLNGLLGKTPEFVVYAPLGPRQSQRLGQRSFGWRSVSINTESKSLTFVHNTFVV